MARYVMQRLLAMLLTLFIIVTVAFLVIRLMPSSIYDDPTISAEVLDMIQAKYPLDRPLIEQYGIFMKNVLLKGDWGISMKIQPNIPVFQVLGGKVVKSHIVYRLCNHMVYTLSLIQPGVIVQEIALFECVNSLVQVDAADSELSEHQCDLPRERRLANGDAFPTKPFA